MDLENKVTVLYLTPKDTGFKELMVQQGFRYVEAHPSFGLYRRKEYSGCPIYQSIVYNPIGFVYFKNQTEFRCAHRAIFIPINGEMSILLRETALNEFKDLLFNMFKIKYEETYA